MWIHMKRDVYNERYGLLPAGKNRNVNQGLAEELIEKGKAVLPDNKATAPSENK